LGKEVPLTETLQPEYRRRLFCFTAGRGAKHRSTRDTSILAPFLSIET
jgi:hypothetical protein